MIKMSKRKMSKLMSLLMVMAMMFMLVPVSALAASGEETTTVANNSNVVALEVVTTGTVVAATTTTTDTTVPTTKAADVTTTTTTTDVAADKTATTEPVVTADKIVETPVVAEQPAVTAVQAPVVAEQPVIATSEAPIVTEQNIEVTAVPFMALYKTDGSEINILATNSGEGYAYNTVTNALTLSNFTGKSLLAQLMGDNFAIVLLGTNTLKTDSGFAVNVDGDLNLSGTGKLIAEGQPTATTLGGGINVTGDLVINSGEYDVTAVGNAGDLTAVGIMSNDLTVNDGNIDVSAINTGTEGAYGMYAYGDLVVNGGKTDVLTSSTSGTSTGIGAIDDIVFNGGKTTVSSNTITGVATAVSAASWLVINHGILDLAATGGTNPLAIYGGEGIYIDPSYGYVDITASSLYLDYGHHQGFQHFNHHMTASSNPKTGVDTSATDAMVAGLALLSLMGLAVLLNKRDTKA
ncbi:LPXTG cell wall anchor domain-containing protein [Acetobacterium tundrae]|uniref:LPXTG cell wall anchor domain-containing protein n=2 Tax=Acetobacterium tundrae TaxID=132932 RepID=A0ABR6WP71_9FIRM|nr:LPXTG cell wall anchor domain-containing protein [Acetobacterium tundrae]